MNEKLKKILPYVSKPGRYIGGEVNSVKKDLSRVDLKVALAFPDVYEIAISNLGLQILYNILNGKEHIAAERVYAPWTDMESLLRKNDIPLSSLESSLPLKDFDIVGFSLQHELGYTNLLNMLDLGGIPLLTSERKNSDPLIIAGGPSAFNPEPMADFIDAFFLGDGEEGIIEICDIYLRWKESGGERKELLKSLASIEGVYVPSLFSFSYLPDGKIEKIDNSLPGYDKAGRRILTNLDTAPYPTRFILPNIRPVHERVPLEVARGCSRFCRFCQAGYIYLPVRERSPQRIKDIGRLAIDNSGLDEVALLSLSTGDYSCIEGLLPEMAKQYRNKKTKLSFPSLRVDTITKPMTEEMKKAGVKSFTIAPEAGSQRLRDFINKGVTEEQILDTVESISQAGCQTIKLYFMIGLPSETKADIDEIISLSKKILKRGRQNGGGLKKVTVNLSTFVPKAHTPFQWARQGLVEETKEKIDYLKKNVRDRNISLKWQEPKMSILEGLFSRGDRRVGRAVQKAFELGARFDAWGEELNFSTWEEALGECGIDIGPYLRERDKEEILPWDHIDIGLEKSFLIKELAKAFDCAYTEDCRYGKCSVCGVCDHKIIKIELYKGSNISPAPEEKIPLSPVNTKLRVKYAKKEEARFIGHIDTMHLVTRLLRRAGLTLAYSEGFNPAPKIAFSSPIPLGTESLSEYFDVEIRGDMPPDRFLNTVRSFLPTNFDILDAFSVPLKGPSLTTSVEEERYELSIPPDIRSKGPLESGIENFNRSESWPIEKKTKKGKKTIDLKTEVQCLLLLSDDKLKLNLAAKGGRKIKAEDAAAGIFGLTEDEKKAIRITKIDTLFTLPDQAEMKVA